MTSRTKSLVIAYFGKDTVYEAIADYFERKGISEVTRDDLMGLVRESEDKFFELVSDYVMNKELT